jgi:hypothetical protein
MLDTRCHGHIASEPQPSNPFTNRSDATLARDLSEEHLANPRYPDGEIERYQFNP